MNESLSTKVIEKFWSQVEKTNYCWNWTGILSKSGTPRLNVRLPTSTNKGYLARRISLILAGKNVAPSYMVKPVVCGNSLCVNPNHLDYGDEARFFSKVSKLSEANGGCWAWNGGLNKRGYGRFIRKENDKQVVVGAHQYSWELANNFARSKGIGLCVCHTCDHPWCVNPEHLFLGTDADNMKDKVVKGRQCKGKDMPNAKLTEVQVREIRELYATGEYSYSQIAKRFGVGITRIRYIIQRISWKHVV